jgi:chromosome segregation protein
LPRVHLRSITLRGFKSFPDPVEIRLEPGVAVVVGPNGSGKSNVADAIVWAAGSLSPSELRAEKADDVLFAGAPGRPAADWCEVALAFDNAEGTLAGLEFSEVSIVRRLHRGGEGQYLVNGAPVRRLDLVELLSDVGLGSGMHSIVGQGRVEAILASRPEERRALVEEAAGLGRFKRRRHRAELKLARVAVDVDRARELEAEVRRRLRPLALQATAAERADRLGAEIAGIQARLAAEELAVLESRRAELEERRAAAGLERRRTEGRLQALLAERDRAEEELADAAGRREAATAALYRVRSGSERLELRRESAAALVDRLHAEIAEAAAATATDGPSPEELEGEAERTDAAARVAARERDALADEHRLARGRLQALERSLAEREGLPPAARALSEAGERLALTLLDVETGYERAVAAALAWRAAALVADRLEDGFRLLERARRDGLGSLAVLVSRPGEAIDPTTPPLPGAEPLAAHARPRDGEDRVAQLLQDVWVVDPAELLHAKRGLVVTRDGHAYAPATGELWFAGETAEALLLELDARRRQLATEVEASAARLGEATAAAEAAAGRAQEAGAALARAAPARRRRAADPALLARLAAAAERLLVALAACAASAARLETPLRARVDAGGVRTGDLAAELRRLAAAEADVRRTASDAGERAAAIDVEIARVEAEAEEARRRVEAAAAEPVGDGDVDALSAKLERLERRREALGRVNPLAKEEYEREKERLDELAIQRADLEASLTELEQLRAELADTVERRFAETFSAVREHFAEVAGTLFPGGEGRLRLTEPAPDEESGGEPGVEVELRPAGKRVTRLSLLSGGEKALGAIAFLFALFLARPCPFYLLDEVEAALDDPNIGRFVELLRRYADRAQFIVITHQKRTMEAADVLYGVTMGPDGVSQVVSRRLAGAKEALAKAG